jgi:hypothetical protein
MEWQSIDTAPKDGTPILVYEGGAIYTAKFDKFFSWSDETGWRLPDMLDITGDVSAEPTHWMPLPEPPE